MAKESGVDFLTIATLLFSFRKEDIDKIKADMSQDTLEKLVSFADLYPGDPA